MGLLCWGGDASMNVFGDCGVDEAALGLVPTCFAQLLAAKSGCLVGGVGHNGSFPGWQLHALELQGGVLSDFPGSAFVRWLAGRERLEARQFSGLDAARNASL